MVLSFIASIHALYMKYQQTVISEDGATFLDEILKVLDESLLIEAFRFAKISGQDEMDYLEVRNVLRIMIIDGEIFRFAHLTSEKYLMKVMNWDKPEQIPNYYGLILSLTFIMIWIVEILQCQWTLKQHYIIMLSID